MPDVMIVDLDALGWTEEWAAKFRAVAEAGAVPARVAIEHKRLYRIYSAEGEMMAAIAGRLRHQAVSRADFPAVGDWVVARPAPDVRTAVVCVVLPRKSRFVRKAAGRTAEEQVVAANVDTVFLVSGLDHDFNPRRIERYLVMAWESGARPVIVLNKADVCSDVGRKVAETEAVAGAVPIHAISCREHEGLDALGQYLRKGQTVALLGSSGVGKTTIINRLVGEDIRRTSEVREKASRGRHTTSWRELIVLPAGASIIDTPGMRELQLWEASQGLHEAFRDIDTRAVECYFHDCRHQTEPRCAVKQAVADGRLAAERLENYHKVQRELELLALKTDRVQQLAAKKKERSIRRLVRKHTPRG